MKRKQRKEKIKLAFIGTIEKYMDYYQCSDLRDLAYWFYKEIEPLINTEPEDGRYQIAESVLDEYLGEVVDGRNHRLLQVFSWLKHTKLNTHTEPEDERYPADDSHRIAYLEGFKDGGGDARTHNQIALRKWKEYQDWMGEWDGDLPAPQEHMIFNDWLQQEDK